MDMLEQIKLNTRIVADREEVALVATRLFIEIASRCIEEKGVFDVAISGGRSPIEFYNKVAGTLMPSGIAWDKIHLFWVDERCVSPDSEYSNYKLAFDSLVSKIPIPVNNVHRMAGEVCDYALAVQEYETVIREHFGIMQGEFPVFDLISLGMGADGHIASLFPNSNALFDTQDIVSPVYMMGEKLNRITLTVPVLTAARNLIVIVSGREKAQSVRDIFCSEQDEIRYPVHALWPILDKVHWILDKEAAVLLNM